MRRRGRAPWAGGTTARPRVRQGWLRQRKPKQKSCDREAEKKVIFLMAVPLSPYPPPLFSILIPVGNFFNKGLIFFAASLLGQC